MTRRGGNATTEADTGVTLHDKELRKPPEAGREMDSLLEPLEGTQSCAHIEWGAGTLTSHVCPPILWEIIFCWSLSHQVGETNKEGHYLMIKGSILQGIIILHCEFDRVSKYIWQKLIQFRGKMNPLVQLLLSRKNRTSKQPMGKDTVEPNSLIDQLDEWMPMDYIIQ